MNCKINIEDLYKEIGRMIEDIIIYNLDFPYKCYLDINNYRNDVINDYKGLLIWETNKYYKIELLNNLESANVGFFIIPEFSNINVNFYQEYSLTLDLIVLSNIEKDRFSYNLMIMTDYIVNKIKDEVKNNLNPDGIYIRKIDVSKPILDGNYSSFVKRNILITFIKCIC